MTVFVWPISVLTPVEQSIQLVYASRSPGDPWEGHRQIITPLVSEWRISAAFSIRTGQKARQYRAMMSSLKGRFNQVDFTVCDPYRGPGGTDITTTAGAAGDEGDEVLSIEVNSFGDTLSEGDYISINDYLYMVQNGGVGTKVLGKRPFTLSPELRENVANGATIRVSKPRIRVRLSDDLTGKVSMHLGKIGTPTVDFVEVLTR